jgi:hypothetical protein
VLKAPATGALAKLATAPCEEDWTDERFRATLLKTEIDSGDMRGEDRAASRAQDGRGVRLRRSNLDPPYPRLPGRRPLQNRHRMVLAARRRRRHGHLDQALDPSPFVGF